MKLLSFILQMTNQLNEALRKADEETENKMGKLTGGMNIPGLF